ncbi:MAG: YfhO family protein [Bacteroidia bacterium]|nr:YfhO family protein [Bacteroidia bacterium]
MKNINFKNFLPHIIAIAVFILLACVYFKPVFDGKKIKQGDIVNYTGMSKEIADFRKQYNEEPLWTNSMFGGMPAFQISVLHPSNLIQYADKIFKLGLPHPVNLVFLYMLGFYLLLLVLRVDPWLGILGAIAFAFSSYFFIIIEAGHNSKAHAIAYMAPTVAGAILAFRGRYLLGGALTALFLALDLYANHPQITYYLLLFLIIYGITELINAIKAKELKGYAKSVGVLAIAGLLAVGTNAGNLLATYQYGKYSTRGKSDLTFNKENKTSGLDKDYATQWSYGKGETMSLLIPDFKGGGSGAIGNSNKQALKDVDGQFKEYIGKSDQYWGDQPFTSGPVYTGAIVVFLFVLGLFIVEGSLKQALVVATLLSIMLAWGKNFMWFSELFLDHFPGYNKFRAVSMILVIAEFAIPLLAVLALDKLIKTRQGLEEKLKLPFLSKPSTVKVALYVSLGLTAGLALMYYLVPGVLTDFFKTGESNEVYDQITKGGNSPEIAQSFLDNLETARKAIFKADAIRTFFLIILAAGVIWLYFKSKIERVYIVITVTFFILADMWSVDKRYVNNDNFVSAAEVSTPFQQTQADAKILEDKDPDFRVLNLYVNTFNDASTSYWHKSIGGYHGAKLKRYQELVDFQIDRSIAEIKQVWHSGPTDSLLRTVFVRQPVLNMLNTKYFILPIPDNQGNIKNIVPVQNRYAMGNAWFVNSIKYVPNADSEITALSNFNPRATAVVDEVFKPELQGFQHKYDSTASIKLTSYKANELTYESNSTAEQLAVFSEIYYKDGWNAYVDGQLTPHVRANYVLRAMRIPAGKHTVVYKFEPVVYKTGEKLSFAMSALLLLSVAGALFLDWKKMNTTDTKA